MRSPQSKLKLVGRFVRTVANSESVLKWWEMPGSMKNARQSLIL